MSSCASFLKSVFSPISIRSKECICMASSMTPAYIRIAGPSTAHMTFRNTTILIDTFDPSSAEQKDKSTAKKLLLNELFPKGHFDTKSYLKPVKTKSHFEIESIETKDEPEIDTDQPKLEITLKKWKKFVQWAKTTGFDLVFALNNEEKTEKDIWDPNTALNILTVAEKADIGDIFWQLGYECNNQSIEEYLNDLETLRVIVETFGPGRGGAWRVVGGDVSNCLHVDSKSDFKDYVMLSDDMMDAIVLNGNSSSQQLARMSEADRGKLVRFLSGSATPLWLTERWQPRHGPLERAADWLVNLGYSARNGFTAHFRELAEEEMYEPTLSFYMALLYKNLVGERVLDLKINADESILFAHCTSLRHKAVPGAVTLYGVNMDDEAARFSIKLSKREEGGDILQFILAQDHNENIIVNGRAMYYVGDIKPVVKRVRPYKTLVINLPPKSFGFWVLANTNVDACRYNESNSTSSDKRKDVDDKTESAEKKSNNIKSKRSVYEVMQSSDDYSDFVDLLDDKTNEDYNKYMKSSKNTALKNIIERLDHELKNVTIKNELSKTQHKINLNSMKGTKKKRQIFDEDKQRKRITLSDLTKKIEQRLSLKPDTKLKSGLIEKILRINEKINNTINKNKQILLKNRPSWRIPQRNNINSLDNGKSEMVTSKKNIFRNRRSISTFDEEEHKINDNETDVSSVENEIDADDQYDLEIAKIIRKIRKQLRNLPIDIDEKEKLIDSVDDLTKAESIQDTEYDSGIEETRSDNDDNKFLENFNNGFIKTTVKRLVSVLEDLNRNFSKLWKTFTVLE